MDSSGNILSPAVQFIDKYADQSMGSHVIGISPFLTQWDYMTESAFLHNIESITELALADFPPEDQKLIVYPEHIGTWFSVLGEPEEVIAAKSLAQALTIACSQPDRKRAIESLLPLIAADDPIITYSRATLLLKAQIMLETYVKIFAGLAKKHNAYIVAGSILAPEFVIGNDSRITITGQKIYNTSIVFNPEGKPIAFINKIHLVSSEQFLAVPGNKNDLKTAQTALGEIGVMICADGWYADTYEAYSSADILVQPSYLDPLEKWTLPWQKGIGATNGDEKLTEGEAWKKYSLEGRFSATNARVGVNVFMHGRIWDVNVGGRAFIIHRNSLDETPIIIEEPDITKPSILHVQINRQMPF
ncbi:MAG TPA: carbon-nitrogen hydrolase family protein [Armatimonadota bacterium]|nr:carbon-nitrogen hydrolase family protein [Armatimonadota bacterium]HOM73344.1 carbon-nitrogen hydrolase family protein [Armatimonadota bacterium]HPP75304.1 carbon-nitrogen hydrolase family protein [Armatimonadota bacterium]